MTSLDPEQIPGQMTVDEVLEEVAKESEACRAPGASRNAVAETSSSNPVTSAPDKPPTVEVQKEKEQGVDVFTGPMQEKRRQDNTIARPKMTAAEVVAARLKDKEDR